MMYNDTGVLLDGLQLLVNFNLNCWLKLLNAILLYKSNIMSMLYEPDMNNLFRWFMENKFKNKFFIDYLNYLYPINTFIRKKYGDKYCPLLFRSLNYLYADVLEKRNTETFERDLSN